MKMALFSRVVDYGTVVARQEALPLAQAGVAAST